MDPRDTTAEAAAIQTNVHRRLGEGGRFRVAAEISDLLRRVDRPPKRQPLRPTPVGPVGGGQRGSGGRQTLSVEDVLARIRAALVATGIPHMLTGSLASSLHGVPRATQDIDIVIAPTREQLLALVAQFPQTEYDVSRDAALDALARHEQFNIIDHATGWKIDFIIRRPRAFSREEFERRR
jgi:hypothetical protein